MKQINYSNNGGLPVDEEGLDFVQTAYSEALAAIAASYGNKVILSGMEVGGGSVAAGWFIYNGEIIKFNASSLATKVKINDNLTSVEFEDGLSKTVYNDRDANCDATGDFDFADLKRIGVLKDYWCKYDTKTVVCDNAYVAANFDGTGLGINERDGWAVCNGQNGTEAMGGLSFIGMQFPAITVDPDDNVWDVIYNTALEIGGEKKHKLVAAEIPVHDHITHGKGVIASLSNFLSRSGSSRYSGSGGDTFGGSTTVDETMRTGDTGGDGFHENRQPFKVALIIQKL